MDKTTEDELKKFDEMWSEPKYQDIGNYYVTMYQILARKKARKSVGTWHAVGQKQIDLEIENSYYCKDIETIKHSSWNPSFLNRVAKNALYWDFEKDAEHQTKGVRIVSLEQLIDADEYYGGIHYGDMKPGQYALVDKDFHIYSYGTYEECTKAYEQHREEFQKKTIEKKKTVNYDVGRTGLPDYRGGRDVTAEEVRETFGLKSVTVSDTLAKKDAHAQLNALYDSLYDIADVFRFSDPKMVSLGGELSIDIGGKTLKNALAHYDSGNRVIEIAKKNRDSGTFIHEYFHAIEKIRGMDVVDNVAMGTKKYSLDNLDAYFKIKKILSNKDTDFYKNSTSMKKPEYWTSTPEMFARAGEAFFADELKKRGAENHFLVNTEVFRAPCYPVGEEKDNLVQLYDEMIGQLFPERETPAKTISGIDALRKQHNENVTAPEKKKTKDIGPDL